MAADETTRSSTTPAPATPAPEQHEHHVEVIEAQTDRGTDRGHDSDLEPLDFDAESSNTSVTSSIYKHQFENGRRYFPFPWSLTYATNDNMHLSRSGNAVCQILLCDSSSFASHCVERRWTNRVRVFP
jgi:hypothetical protein